MTLREPPLTRAYGDSYGAAASPARPAARPVLRRVEPVYVQPAYADPAYAEPDYDAEDAQALAAWQAEQAAAQGWAFEDEAPVGFYDAPAAPQAPARATPAPARAPLAGRVARASHWLGAATAIVLMGGFAVWAVSLVMRDVQGVPVIRALAGPARVAPLTPGVEGMAHTGLAVNQIAAEGAAQPVGASLTLAPAPVDLAATDSAPGEAPAEATSPLTGDSIASAPLTAEGAAALAMADQIATSALAADALSGGTEQLMNASASAVDPITAALAEAMGQAAPVAEATEAPQQRVRPKARPAALGSAVAAAPAAATGAAPSATVIELDPTSLASGTRLVQIGAYDTPEEARAAWDLYAAALGPLMEGKNRVVEPATSGGRTFYRLRVAGFPDVVDARRFCSAADGKLQNCIPAQVR